MGLNGEELYAGRQAGLCPRAVAQHFDLQHRSPCPLNDKACSAGQQMQFTKHQGREDESLGQCDQTALSHLCAASL